MNTLKSTPNSVRCFISASAIGWYGPDTAQSKLNGFHEDAPSHKDFLGQTCKAWEESAQGMVIRTVCLRTGIVLSQQGGALKEFIKPMNAGIAAIIGTGNQTISWIHIEDLCRIYIYALENENLHGAYNAVAPQPVSNKELTLALAEKKRGKTFIPIHIPAFIIKLMLGEMSIEVLKSTTVSADKIKNAGLQFLYPGIHSALEDLITN